MQAINSARTPLRPCRPRQTEQRFRRDQLNLMVSEMPDSHLTEPTLSCPCVALWEDVAGLGDDASARRLPETAYTQSQSVKAANNSHPITCIPNHERLSRGVLLALTRARKATMSPSEPGGVKVSINLDKPLPQKLAGQAAFNLEFLPSIYMGKAHGCARSVQLHLLRTPATVVDDCNLCGSRASCRGLDFSF